MNKVCSKCGETKPPSGFYPRAATVKDGLHPHCKDCAKASSKQWRLDNPARAKAASRAGSLRRMYSLTPEQYESLLAAQQGRCATCLRFPGGAFLAVDHDHATGLVRGLLCTVCNHRLLARHRGEPGAWLFDRAARYLRNPPAQDIMRGHKVAERRPNGRKWEDS